MDNVNIDTNQNNAIYSPDNIKVFVNVEKGSKNNINLTKEQVTSQDTKNSSVIFANDDIVLKDNNGNVLLSHKTNKECHAIIVTSKQLIVGEKYKVVAGTREIVIDIDKGKNEIKV